MFGLIHPSKLKFSDPLWSLQADKKHFLCVTWEHDETISPLSRLGYVNKELSDILKNHAFILLLVGVLGPDWYLFWAALSNPSWINRKVAQTPCGFSDEDLSLCKLYKLGWSQKIIVENYVSA